MGARGSDWRRRHGWWAGAILLGIRASKPFEEEFPRLLSERGLSLSEVARRAGVDKAFLSRAARATDSKRASAGLCAKVARALDLPDDYFAEVREAWLRQELRRDPAWRDRLYSRRRQSKP